MEEWWNYDYQGRPEELGRNLHSSCGRRSDLQPDKYNWKTVEEICLYKTREKHIISVLIIKIAYHFDVSVGALVY
jgi:hypothetical protein